ncbi:MAG: NAD-dependent epimerase/dehydratase family protein [Proteobacteria bacterium]|nr:MAG: NAD-dependent epimerase/dehydratase family protein [Pseudomonadota bacterium]
MKKALLFGATGFIGSHLLSDLLADARYDQVTIVVRRKLKMEHPKLKVLVGDFNTLESLKSELVADDVFITLGTTKKHTPNQAEYYKVDHDYPVLAAKLAQENGAKGVYVVTAIGANADSKIFYTRTKGEVEHDIKSLRYERTGIFEPSMIVGHRKEERPFEKTLIKIWNVVDRALAGPLDQYKGIDGKDVAKAMLIAANAQAEPVKTYRWREMTSSTTREG